MDKAIISTLSAVLALTCASASASENENNEITIITDNFRVEDVNSKSGEGKSLLVVRGGNEIGSLGDKTVVYGEKDPRHLAYVKTADEHNYIITNKLLVQCAKDQYCIPAGLEVEQLSRNIYEVTVQDDDEWKSLSEELSAADGDRSVSASYDHGVSPDLK